MKTKNLAIFLDKKKKAPYAVDYVPGIYYRSYNNASGSYGLTILIFSHDLFFLT